MASAAVSAAAAVSLVASVPEEVSAEVVSVAEEASVEATVVAEAEVTAVNQCCSRLRRRGLIAKSPWRSPPDNLPSTCYNRIHSSRNSIVGSSVRVRCAGIHAAASPSDAIAKIAPASTRGSRGVA